MYEKKIDSQTILSEYVAVACLTATFKTSERSWTIRSINHRKIVFGLSSVLYNLVTVSCPLLEVNEKKENVVLQVAAWTATSGT